VQVFFLRKSAMIKVGILGATGSVGQRFVHILADHPWFEIAALFASERSGGKKYREAAKWFLPHEMPQEISEMKVKSVNALMSSIAEDEDIDVDVMFSALPSSVASIVEKECAMAGYAVSSNVAVHRMEKDVPLVIPEVNADHLRLIEVQKERSRGNGFIITNPNCSVIMLTLSLKPLMKYGIKEVHVATMQALSGAGYAGVASMAIIDNVIPFIEREEGKIEGEPLKILGEFDREEKAIKEASFKICASCNRVPVLDGHTEAVWVKFEDDVDIEVEEVKSAFQQFKSDIKTPFAPQKPIIVREEQDRPQPRLDRDAGKGMSISVGRIRGGRGENELKYVVLGHNTIRGAAGASILNAEVLLKEKYV
jgi:aspartate-semialdehyde dehydrogenase